LKIGGILVFDPKRVKVDREDFTAYALPLEDVAVDATGGSLGKNVVALGALAWLFDMDRKTLRRMIKDRFKSKGSEVVERNLKALDKGYKASSDAGWKQVLHLAGSQSKGENYMLLSGNEAVALGAIVAGCRFTAGYPITPASSIFETLARVLPLVRGKALQMEDEIAAISAAIGASFAGEKALIATSGPGFQLMAEQANLASMIEVPLVIIDVQRGGPSTGMPTKTEQSDLNFAIYGTSGESPRIIMAPTSVEDSFYQTIRAFNLAERYQLPVIILTDQSIGFRKATVRIPDLQKVVEVDSHIARTKVKIPTAEFINLINRIEPDDHELTEYKRFRITDDGISPISKPGTPEGQYLATGLEHSESGSADYSPQNHILMNRKRFRKLEVISQSFESNPIEMRGKVDAKIGIVGWGSTEGAIREARYLAEEKGIYVRHLHPHTLSPMPERQITEFLVRLDYLIIVEENYTGQFAHFIKSKFGVRALELYKCEGIPFKPEEILKGIERVAEIAKEYSIV
jgi:2-oxoglutarate ferredoxin oxidoreductase subunit alpha